MIDFKKFCKRIIWLPLLNGLSFTFMLAILSPLRSKYASAKVPRQVCQVMKTVFQ